MTENQQAEIEWRDGAVPVSTRFADPYYSRQDGLAETRHVFVAGNGLPDRFRPGFHIAELGFGTGLNMLAALKAWIASATPGRLRFTSFEAFPMAARDMAQALAAFPELTDQARPLLAAWSEGRTRIETDHLDARIVLGDARESLSEWHGRADAWFLDGFAPARNPELWQPDLLQEVALHTAPRSTCATYTAAGLVRRALADAGFTVERRPGFGRKRHMTVGRLP
ncbi:MAG: tRNA (5-methylaminomethyl-2-thiouridine)(34)-methyltransferase MnmD [Rhodobacter sp.]|nr:tRNA (5-methylaminomethyl-2-thiouridine)(34)-methyltransferase MnmD [Rhodobacter sp.]